MGTVVVDHQVVVRELPEPDAKAEILSDRFQVGGPVPTALALLTQFGATTSFIGKWATDRWGEMIEDDLGQARVDLGQAVVSPAVRTGFAHVWVEADTGRRSIAAYRGSHPIEHRKRGREFRVTDPGKDMRANLRGNRLDLLVHRVAFGGQREHVCASVGRVRFALDQPGLGQRIELAHQRRIFDLQRLRDCRLANAITHPAEMKDRPARRRRHVDLGKRAIGRALPVPTAREQAPDIVRLELMSGDIH